MRVVEKPSGDLLFEFCFGNGLVMANTFIQQDLDEKVTFREAGITAQAPIDMLTRNISDFFLCTPGALDSIRSLRS